MKLLIHWPAVLSLVSIFGIECLLPRSIMARALPNHPVLTTQLAAHDSNDKSLSHLDAEDFQKAFNDSNGVIKVDPMYINSYLVQPREHRVLGDIEGWYSDKEKFRFSVPIFLNTNAQEFRRLQRLSKYVEKIEKAAKNALLDRTRRIAEDTKIRHPQITDTQPAKASLSPKPAQSPQSAQDVYAVASQTTVLIDGQNPGSGVILTKVNNTYYVLTAKHVVATPDEYNIVVAGGKEYDIDPNKIKRLSEIDLAIVEFTSNQNYPVARVGNSDQVKQGANIYVSGWPLPDEAISKPTQVVTEGRVVGLQPDDKDGYGLLYSNNTAPGMSGGPVLDADGQLVGIHGRASGNQTSGKVGINLGIPINLFLQSSSQAGINLQKLGLKVQNPETVPAQTVSSSGPQPIKKKNAKSQADPNDPTIKKSQGRADQPSEISPNKPKTLSLDTLAIPAGWMGGSNPPNRFVQLSKASSCYSGSNCTEISYSTGGNWAGVVYWPPVCGESGTDQAWENVRSGACGINLTEKEDFTDIERFSFWAKGQGTIEFKVGAVDIPPIPGATTGKVTLSNSWKKYEIPLKAVDLNSAAGLFIWTAADLDNPDGAKFTIDKLQFEGQ